MAMRGKMKSEGGGRRRRRSRFGDSDASDDDYKIEEDGEFDDSDEYCSSLAGEELEDDLVRVARRLKRRNAKLSKSKGRARKVSKERKVSYEEDSDEDFVEDDDGVDEEKNDKSWATGFPRRKRNVIQKAAKKKKASYMEENDEDEAEDHDQDDDGNGNVDDKDLQKGVLNRKQNGVRKAVKENKSAHMEENDDDYDDDDDDDYEAEDDAVDEDEDYYGIEDEKDTRKGCPSRKQKRVRKTLKKKKASYMEESDDSYEAEKVSGDDVEDCDGIEDEKHLRKGCAGRKKNGVPKALKKKASDTEESDDNYEAEDDECDDDDNEDEKDLQNGCLGRKQNRVKKELKEKKDSYLEENDDKYEAEDDECDGYRDIEDEEDLRNGCPGRKQNGVQKALKEKKASYTEESDDDYEAEDDECDEDDDYNDIEEEQDLPDVNPARKQNGDKKALNKKKALYTEEDDDDHGAGEDDECDEDNDNGIEIDGCSSRKQNGVQKTLKEKKASYTEENDHDYKAEDDEFNDDDDYDNEEEESEEEEELEEEDDDEDFTPNEIDLDDEAEFAVEEKAKRVRRTHSQGKRCPGGRKRRRRSTIKSKRKEPAKRRGFQRKSSSGRRKEVKKRKSYVKETNERNSGRKRRRLLVDSDSDFVDSKPLLLDQEYTISEEEREQIREANKFCGNLTVALRNCSSNKRSVEEENLHQERKQKARKGKDKIEGLKIEVAKQVCGICFSEEGKRTVRGTLDCCSHYFCFNCIMEWSKVESRCPLCKQRFVTISKPARSDTVFDLRTTVVPVPQRDQVYQPSEEELRSYLDPYENVICTECHHGGDDANMLLCDLCDSPAHTYCVGLSEVPEGNWYCEGCRPTALGPSNPQTPNFSRDRRTTNDLFARSSSPSANIREIIDLNRVYEPETPLFEGTGMSSSPRPVNGDLLAGSSVAGGVGVQTVRERRRRHQQMAHFVGRNGENFGLGPEVEWGRTRRLGFQNTIRPETSSMYDMFSQGLLHDNFTSPVPSMRLLPATPSHSRVHRAFGQTLTGVNASPDGNGSLQTGLSGITGGNAWSFHGHPSMQ